MDELLQWLSDNDAHVEFVRENGLRKVRVYGTGWRCTKVWPEFADSQSITPMAAMMLQDAVCEVKAAMPAKTE